VRPQSTPKCKRYLGKINFSDISKFSVCLDIIYIPLPPQDSQFSALTSTVENNFDVFEYAQMNAYAIFQRTSENDFAMVHVLEHRHIENRNYF
jgi:hypothetical protein